MVKNKSKSFKSYVIGGVIALLAVGALLVNNSQDKQSTSADAYLTAATDLNDLHGLSVDVADPSKVWLASHTGLFQLQQDKDLFVVGKDRDDYMGFSAHPTQANTFFSSGHPTAGGNIGVQKTTDGAKSWKKLSDGNSGPVDFHTMAVSQANPDVIYGSYRGQLQRSTDGGASWQVVASNLGDRQLISLATDSQEPATVFAATTSGLLVSRDQGSNWATLGDITELTTAVAVNPKSNQEMLMYSQKLGIAKSLDGGKTWSSIKTPLADQLVMNISYDRTNPQTIYAANRGLQLYKSVDGGTTWTKVRELRNG